MYGSTSWQVCSSRSNAVCLQICFSSAKMNTIFTCPIGFLWLILCLGKQIHLIYIQTKGRHCTSVESDQQVHITAIDIISVLYAHFYCQNHSVIWKQWRFRSAYFIRSTWSWNTRWILTKIAPLKWERKPAHCPSSQEWQWRRVLFTNVKWNITCTLHLS